MRIVKKTTIQQWCRHFPQAASALRHWLNTTLAAEWSDIQQVRETFPHADAVEVDSGRKVTVFNIGKHRLVTAIHYNRGTVYAMRFMTHATYDKEAWKRTL